MKFGKCQSLLSALFLMGIAHAKKTYYDKEEILNETQWKDVSIQENAPFHLSVLSQGRYDENLYPKYDKNYYYPSSAGEGVDIYVFDNGFNFTYDEFSDVNANCEIVIESGVVTKPESDKVCYCQYYVFDHGSLVSTAAVGKVSGVAKKANIHGILINDNIEGELPEGVELTTLYMEDVIAGLEYLRDNNLIKPHKTVINFSNGLDISVEDIKNKEIYQRVQKLFSELNDMGVVIVAATNNDNTPVFYDGVAPYPCAFDNAICVGGVGNYLIPGITPQTEEDLLHEDEINSSFYQLGDFVFGAAKSGYGEVDLYSSFFYRYNGGLTYDNLTAPILGLPATDGVEYIENFSFVLPGNSFAAPMVAGIAATLMSEFPEKEFNTETMRQYLTEHAEKDIITDLPIGENYPNLFVNNGKKIVYDATLPTDVSSDEEDDITSENEVEEIEDNTTDEVEVDSADEE